MAYFVKESHMVGNFNGTKKFAAEIFADEETDLPDYDDCTGIDGELTLGSVALVVKSGEACALSTDGKWYRQSDGSEVTTS